VGTDYVGWDVKENWKEFRSLVNEVGLSEMEALQAGKLKY
jgi:hypothetical protein